MRFVLPSLVIAASLSPAMAIEFCAEPFLPIPDGLSSGVTTSLDITCGDPLLLEDLNFSVEITHIWIGEVTVTLSKQGGPQAVLVDQPLAPAQSIFGCSGDDMDAILNDEAASPVEDECASTVPSIQGEFIPGDPPGPLLAGFDGLELCGIWEVTVTDAFPGFTGSIDRWCLLANSDDGGDGGAAVPATTGVGLMLALLALLVVSTRILRRRA